MNGNHGHISFDGPGDSVPPKPTLLDAAIMVMRRTLAASLCVIAASMCMIILLFLSAHPAEGFFHFTVRAFPIVSFSLFVVLTMVATTVFVFWVAVKLWEK